MKNLSWYLKRALRSRLIKWVRLKRQQTSWANITCVIICIMCTLLIASLLFLLMPKSHIHAEETSSNVMDKLQSFLSLEELQLLHKLRGKKYYADDFVELLNDFLHSSTVPSSYSNKNNTNKSNIKNNTISKKQSYEDKSNNNNNNVNNNADDSNSNTNFESYKNAEDEDYDEHDVIIAAKVQKAEEEFITRFVNPFYAESSNNSNNRNNLQYKTTNTTPVTPEDLLEHFYNSAHGELTHLALEAEMLTQHARFAKHEIHSPLYNDPSHLMRRGYGLEGSIFVALLIPPELVEWGITEAVQLQTLRGAIFAEELELQEEQNTETHYAQSPLSWDDKKELWRRMTATYKPHVTNVPTISIPQCTRTVRSIYSHARWPIAVRMGMMEYGLHFDKVVTSKYDKLEHEMEKKTTTTTTTTPTMVTQNAKGNKNSKNTEKTYSTKLFDYWDPFNDHPVPFVLSCMPQEYISTTGDDSRGFIYKDNIRVRHMELPPLTSYSNVSNLFANKGNSTATTITNDNYNGIRFASRHVARFITLQLYRGESYVLLIEAAQIIVPSWDWKLQLLYSRIIFDDVQSKLEKYHATPKEQKKKKIDKKAKMEHEHSELEEEWEEEEQEELQKTIYEKYEQLEEIRAVISAPPLNIEQIVVKCYTTFTNTNETIYNWIEQQYMVEPATQNKEKAKQELYDKSKIEALPHVIHFLHEVLQLRHYSKKSNTWWEQELEKQNNNSSTSSSGRRSSNNKEDNVKRRVSENEEKLSFLAILINQPNVPLTLEMLTKIIIGDYDELVKLIERQLFFNFTSTYLPKHKLNMYATEKLIKPKLLKEQSWSEVLPSKMEQSTTIENEVVTQTMFPELLPNRLIYTMGPRGFNVLLGNILSAQVYCSRVVKQIVSVFEHYPYSTEVSVNSDNSSTITTTTIAAANNSNDNKYYENAKEEKIKLPEVSVIQECWLLFAHSVLHSCVTDKLDAQSHVSHFTLRTPWREVESKLMSYTVIKNPDSNNKKSNVNSNQNVDVINNMLEGADKEKRNESYHSNSNSDVEIDGIAIEWGRKNKLRTSDCLHDMHYFDIPVNKISSYLNEQEDERLTRTTSTTTTTTSSRDNNNIRNAHPVNSHNNISSEEHDEILLASSTFLFAPAEAFFNVPSTLQMEHIVFAQDKNKHKAIKYKEDEGSSSKDKFNHVTHNPRLSVLTDAEDMLLLSYQLRKSGWRVFSSTEPLSFMVSINEQESNQDKDYITSGHTEHEKDEDDNNVKENNNNEKVNKNKEMLFYTSYLFQNVTLTTPHMQYLRQLTQQNYLHLIKELHDH